MTNIKTRFGLLVAARRGRRVRGGAGVRVQRADRDPVREDVLQAGHCVGSAGAGGTFVMQVTSFQATGSAAQMTATENHHGRRHLVHGRDERACEPGWVHRPERHGHGGAFAGAQVHQRSNLVGGDATTTAWTGELRLMPASA